MSLTPKTYESGQTLFTEGEPSNCLYMIISGAISIRKSQTPLPIEIAKVHANEIIGELSFFDRLPRSATAVAIGKVECLEISFEAMEKIYLSIPSYMKAIVASMAERLRKANEQIKLLEKRLS